MDVKEKLNEYLVIKGISVNAFEKSAGLSSGYWRKTKSISANVAALALGIYPDLSAEWLLRGEGAMLRTSVGTSVSAIGSHSSAAGHDVNNGDAVALQRTIDGMQRTIDALSATNARLVELLGK